MSVDRNTNIGAYMIVDGEKTEMIERSVNTCSNEDCKNYKSNKNCDGKFCSICGSLVKPKTFEEEYKTGPRDVYDYLAYEDDENGVDENDLCWTGQVDCSGGVFISNECSPFEKKRENTRLADKYNGVTDLTDIDLSEEIGWFNKKYKTIIDTFKKEFGEDSVKIGWGVIEWYS